MGELNEFVKECLAKGVEEIKNESFDAQVKEFKALDAEAKKRFSALLKSSFKGKAGLKACADGIPKAERLKALQKILSLIKVQAEVPPPKPESPDSKLFARITESSTLKCGDLEAADDYASLKAIADKIAPPA